MQGALHVAYVDDHTTRVLVTRLEGGSWVALGGALPYDVRSTPSIAIDANDVPYVAYRTDTDDPYILTVVVVRHSGGTWLTVGEPGSVGSSPADWGSTSLALSPEGAPLVAFGTIVRKFDGGTWQTVGTLPSFNGGEGHSNLAFSPSGVPHLAVSSDFKITVFHFDGAAWRLLGQRGFIRGRFPDLAFDRSSTPFLAYTSPDGTSASIPNYPVFVMRYDGINWSVVGGRRASNVGGTWSNCQVAISPTDPQLPYVAYTGADMAAMVSRWPGPSSPPPPLPPPSPPPSLSVGSLQCLWWAAPGKCIQLAPCSIPCNIQSRLFLP